MLRSRAAYALSLALLAAACGRTGNNAEAPDTTPTTVAEGGTSPGGTPNDGGAPLVCDGPQPGPAPLGRLGNFELNRSLEALFHDLPTPLVPTKLVEDRYHDDPQSEVDMQAVSMWHQIVHDLAQKLYLSLADMQAITGCAQPLRDEAKCRDQFLEKFLKLVYRRAVSDEDKSEMTQVFADGQKLGGDFESGARAVIEVALQDPDFMYLVEQGDGQATGD